MAYVLTSRASAKRAYQVNGNHVPKLLSQFTRGGLDWFVNTLQHQSGMAFGRQVQEVHGRDT